MKIVNSVDGRVIIRDNFEALLKKHDNLLIFGEDVGKIGDVNHGLEGLTNKIWSTKNFQIPVSEKLQSLVKELAWHCVGFVLLQKFNI